MRAVKEGCQDVEGAGGPVCALSAAIDDHVMCAHRASADGVGHLVCLSVCLLQLVWFSADGSAQLPCALLSLTRARSFSSR